LISKFSGRAGLRPFVQGGLLPFDQNGEFRQNLDEHTGALALFESQRLKMPPFVLWLVDGSKLTVAVNSVRNIVAPRAGASGLKLPIANPADWEGFRRKARPTGQWE
jgi:hypothetical protein